MCKTVDVGTEMKLSLILSTDKKKLYYNLITPVPVNNQYYNSQIGYVGTTDHQDVGRK